MSRLVSLLLVALLVVSATAQDEFPAEVKAFAEAAIAYRDGRIASLESQLTAMRKSKASKQQVAQVKQQLDAIEKAKDLPRPPMYFGDLKVGTVGVLMTKADQDRPLIGNDDVAPLFRVVDVVGPTEAIVMLDDKWPLIVRGMDTTNFVDGRNEYLHDVFIVAGKETYNNAGGGTTSAFVLQKFDAFERAEEYVKSLKKKKK